MRERFQEIIDLTYGFRKLLAFAGVFLLAVIFRLAGLIDGSQVVDLLKNCFVAFCASNSIEHFTLTAQSYFKSNSKIITDKVTEIAKDNL